MLAFIAVSLVLLPLLILSHPHWGQIGHHFVVPSVQGGINSTAVLLIIAMVGTTVAPWQLFFQQSNVIDKRITPRFIKYERGDTTMGAFVVVIGAAAILIVAVYAAVSTGLTGHFTDALGVAEALKTQGYALGALFAIVLLDASIIGAAAVTLSTSYAFGDVFGLKHSLHRSFRDAKAFYGTYAAMIAASAVIVLIPGTPLGLLTEAVQALAGVLLPSASVFLLLLCNDVEVLGPWMNRRWLNVLAGVIIVVLLVLSGTLVISTLFPSFNAATIAIWLAIAVVVTGIITTSYLQITKPRRPPAGAAPGHDDDPGGAHELAHAAARPAQAGAVVDRDQARRADATRLPGRLGLAADREGRPARPRLTRPRIPAGCRCGDALVLRRIVIPMHEVVGALMQRDLHIVDDDLMPYYRDERYLS